MYGGGQTISGNNNSVAEDSEMNLNKDREIGRSISLYKHDIIELLTSDDLFKLTELVEKVPPPLPPLQYAICLIVGRIRWSHELRVAVGVVTADVSFEASCLRLNFNVLLESADQRHL